jgi:hypothetical protein
MYVPKGAQIPGATSAKQQSFVHMLLNFGVAPVFFQKFVHLYV